MTSLRRVAAPGFLVLLASACLEPVPIQQDAGPIVVDSPAAVVTALERAYEKRDLALLSSVLAHDADRNAAYVFYLHGPSDASETAWTYAEEVRIHRRMFDPTRSATGEPPVPRDLWQAGAAVSFRQITPFEERFDLYSADAGADGKLDPAIWRVTDARYSTEGLFRMKSENDYLIQGDADLVVLEDLTRGAGEDGKFCLYAWEDLGVAEKPAPGPAAILEATWSTWKRLYR